MANERILSAYPIFVKNPSFSLWSGSELLNESNLHVWWADEQADGRWSGEKKLFGFLKSKGKTYCFMGDSQEFASCGVIKAKQKSLRVTAFTTDYEFEAGEATLRLRFVSPLLPDDNELISMPVCYLEYEIAGDPKAEISLFANRNLAFNDLKINANNEVRGDVVSLGGFESAFLGLKRQLPFSCDDDSVSADCGYWYLAGEKAYFLDDRELCAYLAGGFKSFAGAGAERWIAAMNGAGKGAILIGFDETYSIDYFGTALKGLYLQTHTIFDGLQTVRNTYGEIDRKLAAFDEKLQKQAKPFGKEYLNVLYASLRQSVAAHLLTRDPDGKLLFLSKECCSNGCIATVDVSYPSMPLYLLYNPELVKGMMRPVLKFAKMPVWKYDFAPHDAGTYPACCGQVYGLNPEKKTLWKNEFAQTHFPIYGLPASFDAYDIKYQMPVEECANLLVMWLACYRADGDIAFFAENRELADSWVEYLVKFGLKPENQLCTDDFAGHLKNNLNLAIKAAVGIAAYAELSEAAGTPARKYRQTAEEFAREITKFGEKFKHLPLTWDSDDGTFSLKYNFAFDKIFRLGLFEQSVLEREVDCYLQRANEYGVPLDTRESYSKTDWICWAAALTDDKEKQKKLIAAIDKFLKESKDRVPFGDWYNTITAAQIAFRARSVQGGCFILLL